MGHSNSAATAMTDTESMISLRNLRVSYGEREILQRNGFGVMAGETLVIPGGFRSGKGPVVPTLGGLQRPSSRQIWLKGKNNPGVSSGGMDEIRKKIGMS